MVSGTQCPQSDVFYVLDVARCCDYFFFFFFFGKSEFLRGTLLHRLLLLTKRSSRYQRCIYGVIYEAGQTGLMNRCTNGGVSIWHGVHAVGQMLQSWGFLWTGGREYEVQGKWDIEFGEGA